jgi:hypothetical protein
LTHHGALLRKGLRELFLVFGLTWFCVVGWRFVFLVSEGATKGATGG